jgi:hypothetical protein
MANGIEPFNQQILDSLEKKYQLFLEAPEGEINVYLALSKTDELKSKATSNNPNRTMPSYNSNITDNTLNMLEGGN